MICKICKKKLVQFDDVISRCIAPDHKTAVVMQFLDEDLFASSPIVVSAPAPLFSDRIEFEHIKINLKEPVQYAFEFNYKDDFTQVVRITPEQGSELQIPFYFQKGILEVDFSDIKALIEKIETLEVFS